MPDPVLLALEDDPTALGDVERELRARYAGSYRVVCTRSADEARDYITRLADAGEELALVLAAQWLAGTTGSELLGQVRRLHPLAKRALLIPWRAWAHQPTAEAIFDSMALGRIDYYVLRPATSPDELFHQAITSFLLEWTKAKRSSPHTIHVVGDEWSGRAYELRDVFQRCAMPHSFCLAESSQGRELLARAGSEATLPLIVLPDGRVLSNPTNLEIAEAAGVSIDPEHDDVDVVIVGAGPAGLSAAVYGASEGLQTLVLDQGSLGGQATSSSLIRNYMGFPRGISGGTLAEQAYEQAWVFRANFAFFHRAENLIRDGDRLVLTTSDDRRVKARAVILAMGASYRRLGVPSLEALTGAGVFYGGPASESYAMAGRAAYIVGGANSAGQAALHLARYARQVTLVVRAESLEASMSHYLIQELEATSNVAVRTQTAVVGGGGDGRLEHLVLRAVDGGDEETVDADGLFVLIGAHPCTDWLPAEIASDDRGFVLTGEDVQKQCAWPLERPPFALETSMPGVLAAGDVRRGSVKRVASAVGDGAAAIQLVHSLFASDGQESGGAGREIGAARA